MVTMPMLPDEGKLELNEREFRGDWLPEGAYRLVEITKSLCSIQYEHFEVTGPGQAPSGASLQIVAFTI